MRFLTAIIFFSGFFALALCQRYTYGRQPYRNSGQQYGYRGQPYQTYRPQSAPVRSVKAVAVISGKVNGVINFEQIVCFFYLKNLSFQILADY